VSAQTRQTTLTGDDADSGGEFRDKLRGLGIAVWDAGATAPPNATARHIATVALLARERGVPPRRVWWTDSLDEIEDGGRE